MASPAAHITAVRAGASSSRPAAAGAAPLDAHGVMQALRPEGRNTLVVCAAAQALKQSGISGGRQGGERRYLPPLDQLAEALLRLQPPVTLDAFLDGLLGSDPAQRDGATALKTAFENEPGAPSDRKSLLKTCINALSQVPREQRMLTPEQALHGKLAANKLKTLLPEADLDLLKRVLDSDTNPGNRNALRKQALLIRLGVGLTAQGYGGLQNWIQMQRQPDGAHLANELLDRFKNDPQLKLSNETKTKLDFAVGELRAAGLGGQAGSVVSAASSPTVSRSNSSGFAAAPPAVLDALLHVPPAGRNMLVVYALDQAHSEQEMARSTRDNARSLLSNFGDALLQGRPSVTLDVFLDHLLSADPAQRSAAEARKLAYENQHRNKANLRSRLDTCINALAELPREQRRLTLGQALQRKVVARSLKTLLPAADLPLLQRVQSQERQPDGDTARHNQTMLIRFGVALMARGHGGLAAWMQMRDQPDGIRRAAELSDSIKNGPELNLPHDGKRQFAAAVGQLVARGLGEGAATVAAPQAATIAGIARTPPAASAATETSSAVPSPIAAAAAEVSARPGTPSWHPEAAGEGTSGDLDAQAVPPQGRNTLVVYAAERALREAGRSDADDLRNYRSAFSRFADALLQQHHITLDTFLDRMSSPDPAQRDEATALKAAYEYAQKVPEGMRSYLNGCIGALDHLPRERRMLTLDEGLGKMRAPALKTLLPEADLGLLQQVQARDAALSSRGVQRHQALLIRLGVALMAKGHGGLAGWLRMHDQPDGPRLAGELLDRIKNGPELQLSDGNKQTLATAAGRLRECRLDPGIPAAGDLASPDPLEGFAESLELSLLSPGQASAASPSHEVEDDLPLVDPGTPTEGDLTFLGSLDLIGRGAIQRGSTGR